MREAIKDWALIGWLALLEFLAWLDQQSAAWPPLSWGIHGLVAIPLAALAWWCPLVVFGIREAEQAIHAHVLGEIPLTKRLLVDRVMDVLVPAVVGWWLG